MDKLLLIKIGLISTPFIFLCMYSLVNVIKVMLHLNKEEKKIKMKRKIIKRDNSNVYDLKTRRR